MRYKACNKCINVRVKEATESLWRNTYYAKEFNKDLTILFFKNMPTNISRTWILTAVDSISKSIEEEIKRVEKERAL